jgi:hypothetical protein
MGTCTKPSSHALRYFTLNLTRDLKVNWCKLAPKESLQFWPNFFDHTLKESLPNLNRFILLSQVFVLDFLLF